MRRILIIDDDKDYAELLMIRLTQAGYESEWFNGCEAATKRLDQSMDFDIVVLDVEMPEKNGMATLAYLKNHFKTRGFNTFPIPVIVATGLQSQELREIFLDEDVADYIQKPFDSTVLTKKIEKILSKGK